MAASSSATLTPEPEAAPLAAARRERLREGVTMALYISLSLLAVMVALPTDLTHSTSESPAALLFVTSLGLLVAHQLAFRLSARFVHGQLASEHLELLAAQLAGGLAVAAVAVVPPLLLGPRGVFVAELLLIAFIAVVGYAAARTVPMSRVRAAGYMTAVVGLTLVTLWIKNLVHH